MIKAIDDNIYCSIQSWTKVWDVVNTSYTTGNIVMKLCSYVFIIVINTRARHIGFWQNQRGHMVFGPYRMF